MCKHHPCEYSYVVIHTHIHIQHRGRLPSHAFTAVATTEPLLTPASFHAVSISCCRSCRTAACPHTRPHRVRMVHAMQARARQAPRDPPDTTHAWYPCITSGGSSRSRACSTPSRLPSYVSVPAGGVQSQTITVDRQMRRYSVPRLAFINKCDRAGAAPWRVIGQIRDKLGHNCAAVHLPIGLEDDLRGLVDLVHMKAYSFEGAHGEQARNPIPPPPPPRFPLGSMLRFSLRTCSSLRMHVSHA